MDFIKGTYSGNNDDDDESPHYTCSSVDVSRPAAQ